MNPTLKQILTLGLVSEAIGGKDTTLVDKAVFAVGPSVTAGVAHMAAQAGHERFLARQAALAADDAIEATGVES